MSELPQYDPRVQQGMEKIDEEVGEHDEAGREGDGAQDHRNVERKR